MSVLHVSLEQFEGPLALLLYLIRKEEMDIYNISIHRITKQYLEHIQMMKKLDLEVASEFITMAATLIHIKSKMLLPQYDDEDGEENLEDPRKELIRQLVEYQRYQNVSKKLLEKPILGRDQWRRGFKEDIVLEENQDIEIEENGLFGLIATFRTMVRAAQKRIHRVMVKGQSIASRILEIRDLLIPGERKVMKDLIRQEEASKNKVLVTFLSLLELAKMGFVRLFQSEPYADIHVETVQIIDRDVIQRVESYEGHAEQAQEKLQEQANLATSAEQNTAQSVQQIQNHADAGEMVFDSATDEDIMNAEKELGFESTEVECIASTMEPVEDIVRESMNISQEEFLEIQDSDKPKDGELT